MKRLLISGSVVAAVAAMVLVACSELKKDLVSPVLGGFKVHPASWTDTTSPGFHGKVVLADTAKVDEQLRACAKCHSSSYNGGTSGVSCYACHADYPHMPGWVDSAAATFHGEYLQGKGFNLSSCTSCHGSDYTGGSSGVSCFSCHPSYPHNASWMTGGSPSSHGVYLKNTTPTQWNTQECAACHGTTYAGGNTGVSCYTCHAPYPHDVAFGAGRHTGYMYSKGYPLKDCQLCHGASYTGGAVVDVSCEQSGCHVDANSTPKSPEACNTCHGTFRAPVTADPSTWAPPRDLLGNMDTTFPGVGAHQRHFAPNFSNTLQCQQCHTVPSNVFDAGHIGSQPYGATLTWGSLATLTTANGTYTPNPSYDRNARTCNNTYCHGAWRLDKASSSYPYMYTTGDSLMGGENFAPVWNGGSGQVQCGSCHGLPPRGHVPFAIDECYSCHTDVIDKTGKIIDPTKHINGKVNVFGTEYSF